MESLIHIARRLLYQAAHNAGGCSFNPKLARIMRKLSAAELQDLAGTLENWAAVIIGGDVDLAKYENLIGFVVASRYDAAKRGQMVRILQRWARQLRGIEPIAPHKLNRLHNYSTGKYLDLN